jgi:hypothetical protein
MEQHGEVIDSFVIDASSGPPEKPKPKRSPFRESLSIHKNIFRTWTRADGFRELVSNAYDAARDEYPTPKLSWSVVARDGGSFEFHARRPGRPNPVVAVRYSAKEKTATIYNSGSALRPKALLLGYTTKDEGDDDTVGRFGVGLKAATAIFSKDGAKMTIESGDVHFRFSWGRAREIMDGEQILYLRGWYLEESREGCTITIKGIKKGDLDPSCFLFYVAPEDVIRFEKWSILRDPGLRGLVYVQGFLAKRHHGDDTAAPYYGWNTDNKVDLSMDRRVPATEVLIDEIIRALERVSERANEETKRAFLTAFVEAIRASSKCTEALAAPYLSDRVAMDISSFVCPPASHCPTRESDEDSAAMIRGVGRTPYPCNDVLFALLSEVPDFRGGAKTYANNVATLSPRSMDRMDIQSNLLSSAETLLGISPGDVVVHRFPDGFARMVVSSRRPDGTYQFHLSDAAFRDMTCDPTDDSVSHAIAELVVHLDWARSSVIDVPTAEKSAWYERQIRAMFVPTAPIALPPPPRDRDRSPVENPPKAKKPRAIEPGQDATIPRGSGTRVLVMGKEYQGTVQSGALCLDDGLAKFWLHVV